MSAIGIESYAGISNKQWLIDIAVATLWMISIVLATDNGDLTTTDNLNLVNLLQVSDLYGEQIVQANQSRAILRDIYRLQGYVRSNVSDDSKKIELLEKRYKKVREKLRHIENEYIKLYRNIHYTKAANPNEAESIAASTDLKRHTVNKIKEIRVLLQNLTSELAILHNDCQASLLTLAATLNGKAICKVDAPLHREPAKIDANGHVNRILFGEFSTGGQLEYPTYFRYTRPLGFDFGTLLTTHNSSPSPNIWDMVDIDKVAENSGQNDFGMGIIMPVMLYHSGIYTPEWFQEKYKGDRDTYDESLYYPSEYPASKNAPVPHRLPLNCLRSDILEYIEEFIRAHIQKYRDSKRTLFYEYAAEHLYPGGWGPTATKLFREYLHRKYETIEKLNRIWNSEYPSFDTIDLPPFPTVKSRYKATGLTYEHELWRKDSFAGYHKWCYDKIKKYDPNRPAVISPSSILPDNLIRGIDGFKMAEAVDIVESHCGDSRTSEIVYIYSISHLMNKPAGNFEFIWNAPEGWEKHTEEEAACAGERNAWREITWGKNILWFFGVWDTYGGKTETDGSFIPSSGDFMCRHEADLTLLRYAIGFLPPFRERLDKIEQVFLNTRIQQPQVAILLPSVSMIDAWPSGGPSIAIYNFHNALYQHNLHHFFVPEEFFIDGREDLCKYKVICIPYATHFPNDLGDKLLKWVKEGGVLISAGPFDLYNAYGRSSRKMWQAIFGEVEPKLPIEELTEHLNLNLPKNLRQNYAGANLPEECYRWELSGLHDNPAVREVARIGRSSTAIQAISVGVVEQAVEQDIYKVSCGRGKVFLSNHLWGGSTPAMILNDIVREAIDSVPYFAGEGQVDLIMRQAADGTRYLTVINASAKKNVKGLINLPCRFSRIIDMGAGIVVEVPFEKSADSPNWQLKLMPGSGTIYKLEW